MNSDSWPWGGEPIYCNGHFAGKTTTTGYGYTLGHQVCLGFVQNIDPVCIIEFAYDKWSVEVLIVRNLLNASQKGRTVVVRPHTIPALSPLVIHWSSIGYPLVIPCVTVSNE